MTTCFQLKIYYMDDQFWPNVYSAGIFSMSHSANFLNVQSVQHLTLVLMRNPT